MERGDGLGGLASFLPKLVLEGIPRDGQIRPAIEQMYGVLLWADVSGFTPLVERLARDQAAGAERLSDALGSHFGRFIELVEVEGGDVLFLAGDGALALWRVADSSEAPAILARVHAVAQRTVSELDGQLAQPDVPIRLRVALSSGRLAALNVGGFGSSWLTVVTGQPLQDLGRATRGSAPGKIAMGAPDRESLENQNGPSSTSPGASLVTTAGRRAAPLRIGTVDPRSVASYVMPPIVARMEAGQGQFLAEFRPMTVAFVDLSAVGQEPELDRLQDVVAILQKVLADYGGTVYQLVQDEKGTSAIVVFGLPGCSHEDDPIRAIRFARQASEDLAPLIGRSSFGISTGPVFCGPCGSSSRRQYALFGRPMNRAARLMGAADGAILLDDETHRCASPKLRLGPGRRLSLKGVDGPVDVYLGNVGSQAPPPSANLIGRLEERKLLVGKVEAVTDLLHREVVVVRGPPGIGKTTLLEELRRVCQARGQAIALASADFVESRTPLFALRGVLKEMLGLSSVMTLDEVQACLADSLREIDENVELLPLLGQALGYPTEESALVLQMTAAVRAESRNRILLGLVARAARRQRWVAVIDDLHWSDSATAALLPQLADVPGVLWVLASRPDGSAADVLAALAERGTELVLSGLERRDISELAAVTLGAQAIPESLTAFLVERTDGNPLYSRELALLLQETHRLAIVGGRCVLGSSFRPEALGDLPRSLSALIKSRFDRLPFGAQASLRIASVIGHSFELRVLAEVRGAEIRPEDGLDLLVAEGILRPENRESAPAYAFSHAAIHSVIYRLLPERQTRELHRATGLALEKLYGATTPAMFGRLSYHWSQAGESAKAAEYSALAARQALEGYANRDAIELFERALRNREASSERRDRDTEGAKLYAGLAEAHYGLTEVPEARKAFETAFRVAGFPDPGAGVGVFRGIVRYLLSRVAPGWKRTRDASDPEGERLLAGLTILSEWTVLDFWEARLTEGAAKSFVGHSLAKSVISAPRAAEAVARLGYVLSMTPFRRFAERELLRGVDLANRSGDLQAMASTQVFLGMYYTLSGRSAEALGPLARAQYPVERLGAGLWRHRAWFMLGETLLCLGRLDDARSAFARAAEISVRAEPPVAGMSTSMGALAVARLGRLDEALALLDGPGGLPLITGNFLALQRFTSLGVKAEVLTRLGRLDEALLIAREAQALADRGQHCEVFFAGLHGYAGIVEAHLGSWERNLGGEGAQARAEAACRRLRRFARLYPAAWPRADLLRGRLFALAGRGRAARRMFLRALSRSRRMRLPYEERTARAFLSDSTEGTIRQG